MKRDEAEPEFMWGICNAGTSKPPPAIYTGQSTEALTGLVYCVGA